MLDTMTKNDFTLVKQVLSDTTQQLPWNDLVLYNFAEQLSDHPDIEWTVESLDAFCNKVRDGLDQL